MPEPTTEMIERARKIADQLRLDTFEKSDAAKLISAALADERARALADDAAAKRWQGDLSARTESGRASFCWKGNDPPTIVINPDKDLPAFFRELRAIIDEMERRTTGQGGSGRG